MTTLFRTETTERIVNLLYLTPSRSFVLGEILDAIGDAASRRTILYTLDELVDDGLVVKEPQERGWPTYRANERGFAFRELCGIAAKSLGGRREIASLIADSDDIIGAAIFGSTARGSARADSDIDMLLVVRDAGSLTLADLTATLYEAGDRAGRTVNYNVYELDEFRQKSKSGFIARVLASDLLVLREDVPLFRGD